MQPQILQLSSCHPSHLTPKPFLILTAEAQLPLFRVVGLVLCVSDNLGSSWWSLPVSRLFGIKGLTTCNLCWWTNPKIRGLLSCNCCHQCVSLPIHLHPKAEENEILQNFRSINNNISKTSSSELQDGLKEKIPNKDSAGGSKFHSKYTYDNARLEDLH